MALVVVSFGEPPTMVFASTETAWATVAVSPFPGQAAHPVCVPASYHGESALSLVRDQLPACVDV
jgi:hypothetical protein